MVKRRGKGDGSIYQRHDHKSCPPIDSDGHRPEHRCQGRYVGVVDLGWSGGKRQRRTFYGGTEREVKIKIKTAMSQRDAGVLVASSPTVEAWMTYWLDVICAERQLKPNTMRSHRSKVQQYIIPNLGRHRLDRLAPEHVRAMYAHMRDEGLAEGTLRQTHAILRRALTVAVRERKTPHNVAAMIDPPGTAITTEREPLTIAEARPLAASSLRWWVALYLGLRQSEALGLMWKDVDLDGGTLTIRRTLVRIEGKGLTFGTPKSRSSARVLPLTPKSLAHFRLAAYNNPSPDSLIFHRGGRPIDHRADWQAWRDALDAHGIAGRPLHAARHTTASLLEAEGVPDRIVMQILGQSSIAVTHNYQHADIEQTRAYLARIEGASDAPTNELTDGAGG